MTSDVAAVLSLLSPHDANVAAQRVAMKKISRIHHQLASDIQWDPGKRKEEEEKRRREEEEEEKEEEGGKDGKEEDRKGEKGKSRVRRGKGKVKGKGGVRQKNGKVKLTAKSSRRRAQSSSSSSSSSSASSSSSSSSSEGEEERKSGREVEEERREDLLLANGSPVQAKLDLLMSNRRGRPPKLDPSLIITPSFRLVAEQKAPAQPRGDGGEAPELPAPVDAATATDPPTSTSSSAIVSASPPPPPLSPSSPSLPSAGFFKRHLPLARAERRMRLQQRRESTESWIICDHCRKWRLLTQRAAAASSAPPSSSSSSSYTPPLYFCGGGKKPKADECARMDDWIVRCVGEQRARQLSDVGVSTVEGMERSGVRADREKRMERLGMYFDRETQKIKAI